MSEREYYLITYLQPNLNGAARFYTRVIDESPLAFSIRTAAVIMHSIKIERKEWLAGNEFSESRDYPSGMIAMVTTS